jgi:hypothetical protein
MAAGDADRTPLAMSIAASSLTDISDHAVSGSLLQLALNAASLFIGTASDERLLRVIGTEALATILAKEDNKMVVSDSIHGKRPFHRW